MRDTKATQLADRLDEEAADLERRSKELEDRTEAVARDWAQKRSDPKVPGAPPDDDDEEDEDGDGWDDPDEEQDDDEDEEEEEDE